MSRFKSLTASSGLLPPGVTSQGTDAGICFPSGDCHRADGNNSALGNHTHSVQTLGDVNSRDPR